MDGMPRLSHLQLSLAFAFFVTMASAQTIPSQPDSSTITATEADRDVPLTTDPSASFWQQTRPVFITGDTFGNPVPSHRTEVRSRWTKDSLYLLFISPYEQLNLKPSPQTATETNQLWNWDVAEAFIGSDFKNIRQYKEFEMSPQGEWVDLDIDLAKQGDKDAWKWNSGIKVSARIDRDRKIWYGAMRIPFASLGASSVASGTTFRINLFRCQGPTEGRHYLSWQPSMSKSFHVPEHFGTLVLASAKHPSR
ncbi:cellulose/xylan binding protein with CBM9 domain [Edaphobacter modestus]|uniref:Cellulose/xylan binding protein with CBM9 domain n=2 Tax=Edaphobacter modestus TaxID=388466 RepID=A0A4Q7YPQ8_9BACT|nr:cellulose/xylan binding protein with CBM9 domain [Edaphobacter modestus]